MESTGKITAALVPYSTTVLSPRRLSESQYHRKIEAGRDLWTSSDPTCLLKQGHLEQAAYDHVQAAFEYIQQTLQLLWATSATAQSPSR